MKVALKTSTGNYVTAVNDGGIGDPSGLPFNSTAVHTNATKIGPWETFKIVPVDGGSLALQTVNGQYVTAVNGGSMGDPAGLPFNSTAVHTNATALGPWEVFTLVPISSGTYALQTGSGNYLTAVNGGGIGDPAGSQPNSWPIHTDAKAIGSWEQLTMVVLSLP